MRVALWDTLKAPGDEAGDSRGWNGVEGRVEVKLWGIITRNLEGVVNLRLFPFQPTYAL